MLGFEITGGPNLLSHCRRVSEAVGQADPGHRIGAVRCRVICPANSDTLVTIQTKNFPRWPTEMTIHDCPLLSAKT